MNKIKSFIKNLRIEYKVAGFFIILLIVYGGYSLISKILIDRDIVSLSNSFGRSSSGSSSSSNQPDRKGVNDEKRSISESVSADRPIIFDQSGIQSELNGIVNQMPEIKGAEIATAVENPIIWIYIQNDGVRHDDLAAIYCDMLRSKGVMAASVLILDEAARAKGRMVEMGEKKCI